MIKVIIETRPDESKSIYSKDVAEATPIFAKKEGRLAGMVVNEKGKGWILKIGGKYGCSGWFLCRDDCLSSGEKFGYEFYIV